MDRLKDITKKASDDTMFNKSNIEKTLESKGQQANSPYKDEEAIEKTGEFKVKVPVGNIIVAPLPDPFAHFKTELNKETKQKLVEELYKEGQAACKVLAVPVGSDVKVGDYVYCNFSNQDLAPVRYNIRGYNVWIIREHQVLVIEDNVEAYKKFEAKLLGRLSKLSAAKVPSANSKLVGKDGNKLS